MAALPAAAQAYCATLDGVLLPTSRCSQLLAFQGSQLALLVLCMRRVLQLVGQLRPLSVRSFTASSVLFTLHVLLSTSATMLCVWLLAAVWHERASAALMISGSVGAATWVFFSVVLCLERSQCVCASKTVTIFVVLSAVEELVLVQTSGLSGHLNIGALLWWKAVISSGIPILAAFRGLQTLHSHGDKSSAMRSGLATPTIADNPLDHVGLLSQLSYRWVSPFIALGKQRRIEMYNIPNLPVRDDTTTAAVRFERTLQQEFDAHNSAERSFLRVGRQLYVAEVVAFGIWSAANKAIGLLSPLLIKLFLEWAASPNPSLSEGYALAGAMVTRSVLSAVSGTQYSLAWKRFDLRVRAGLVSAIYARTLKLSARDKRRAGGLGRITNLLSVDVDRIVGMPGTVFDMVLIPAEIAVALLLLSQAVSVAFVAGVAVLAIMLPLQTVLGRKIQTVTKEMLRFRDERVGLTAEGLKFIRTLKLLGWVSSRLEAMGTSRALEMGRLKVRKYLDALCVFFWASTPVIVQVSVFTTVVYSGHDVTAAEAFTTVALLDRLIFPMNYLPWIISGFLEARVSALRIRAFLFDQEGANAGVEAKRTSSYEPPFTADASERQSEAASVVSLTDCHFTWGSINPDARASTHDDILGGSDTETPLLGDEMAPAPSASRFELHIDRLELCAGSTYVVCGPVGAGKSSLLLALLGEMRRKPGENAAGSLYRRRSSMSCSYAPQNPWIFRASVQANVTLCGDEDTRLDAGEERVDLERFNRVLHACELDKDLERMDQPYDVAEGGSNFSGGQRARINLARALYQRSGLYLLDDPLSGLDTNTARKVVGNCFTADATIFPRDVAVVLVTHSLHLLPLLPASVKILVMEGGGIVEEGTYEELLALGSSGRLTSMLETVQSQEEPASTPDNQDRASEEVRTEGDATGGSQSLQQEEKAEGKGTKKRKVSNKDEEHRETGVVNWQVWKSYALAVGWLLSGFILLAVAVMQVSRNSLDWWIAVYTNGSHAITPLEFASVLLYIAGANIAAVFFRSFLFAYGGLRAARATYAQLVRSIFAAPLRFFERTPIGRVLNRLSGDTYTVDESLPFTLNIFLKDAAEVVGALVILFYGNRLVLVLLLPLSVVYFRMQRDYRPSSRHLKRLDASAQSPLLAMFTDTLDGLTVIRAARKTTQYARSYCAKLDRAQRVSFLGSTTGAWFGLRLDMLGVCVTSFVAVFAVADFQLSGNVNPGILGLTLTYALPIVGKLNSILNSFVDTERQMIAVERVKEYASLDPEEAVVGMESIKKPVSFSWPTQGRIEISGLTVTYATQSDRDTDRSGGSEETVDAPAALRNLICHIPAGQKLGICGRTGAGKTTLLNALFRAVPWARDSSIAIDGVSLDSLSLQDLRSRLTYIPQDAVLFSGTVRFNLDPAGLYDDQQLWEALRLCGGVADTVAKLNGGLDAVVEGGAEEQEATFSQGQAQLVCIARALLRPSKVLCIDEATASIDHKTERVISEAIATVFASATVLTVAHRIQTIMHCDRVLLLDEGRVAESGDPKVLAQDPKSLFHHLANAAASGSAELL